MHYDDASKENMDKEQPKLAADKRSPARPPDPQQRERHAPGAAEALSMGMATILKARRIVLIATGKSKARCVDLMVNGPITTKLPASFLQLHRDVELMLDQEAAKELAVRS